MVKSCLIDSQSDLIAEFCYISIMGTQSKEEYILNAAKRYGITYTYTEEEYRRLLDLAHKLHLSHEPIESFSWGYKNVQDVNIPELMRIGKMNALIGMFHDASLKRYGKIVEIIELTKEEYKVA